jgi:hypothetical protein
MARGIMGFGSSDADHEREQADAESDSYAALREADESLKQGNCQAAVHSMIKAAIAGGRADAHAEAGGNGTLQHKKVHNAMVHVTKQCRMPIMEPDPSRTMEYMLDFGSPGYTAFGGLGAVGRRRKQVPLSKARNTSPQTQTRLWKYASLLTGRVAAGVASPTDRKKLATTLTRIRKELARTQPHKRKKSKR